MRRERFLIDCFVLLLFCGAILPGKVYSQAEVQPWGNITGIRVDGQLMAFESSIRVVGADWSRITSTAKERQQPKFARKGNVQTVTTQMGNLFFTEKVEDSARGIVKVSIQCTSGSDTTIEGIYLCVELPDEDFKNAKIGTGKTYGVDLLAQHRQFVIESLSSGVLKVNKEVPVRSRKVTQIYMSIHTGPIRNGETVQREFIIGTSGEIDKKPIELTLNSTVTGRPFEGLGGNFRIQNTRLDPQVIDYSLNNLRLAWGRVELPWSSWQPVKDSNPLDSPVTKLNPRVVQAMEMAQRLAKLNVPVILSAWFPPAWAVEGELNMRPRFGIWGNPLNQSAMNEIYKSIADYVEYLKTHYGVEIALFSFNESDLGINVRQTAQQHADLIKGLGAYFVSRGLKTKMLLGDNSDANSYSFINVAMNDPEAKKYIGAISFHSWRGWENETLQKWADAATQTNLPLIVGEGSIDAAAWNYPAIFLEPVYALAEINLYTRIQAICQPASILQWQLTSDYSPLAGGGIFGNNEPLRPTQRFWNLKQLSSIPQGLKAMPITCNKADVSCAALGDNAKNRYSIQLVNNGATRKVILKGIPKKVRSLRIWVTDRNLGMQESTPVKVSGGQAIFSLKSQSYTTLISGS